MPQLLIVDDHPLYREGVIVALQSPPLNAEVFGAGSVNEALDVLAVHPQIDLVLVDRWLEAADGLHVIDVIGSRHPAVSRMIVSGDASPAAIEACRSAAVQGFLPKSLPRDALIAAIERVLDGGEHWPLSPTLPAGPGGSGLTDRQREVLALLAHGHSNAQIAAALGIAERTAKAHMAGIFDALSVDNRVMALVRARELGLVH